MVATAPGLWRMQKTIARSGHTLHPQRPSPVSAGFLPPAMVGQIGFRPEALAAAMARTLTLRAAPPALLRHWARSQLAEVEYLIADGVGFGLSPDLTMLADAERTGFAGRVGAGITDLLMNALGYVWRDNGACLGTSDPHADFIYAGGAATGHGVVLAEARGSFAQDVTASRVSGEAQRKYRRQIKPYIAKPCIHGKVVHGYAVSFGSNPTSHDTFLHIAETRVTKPRKAPKYPAVPAAPPQAAPARGLVPTSIVLASHRANFLLMGASNVVAWIDWLRNGGERPDERAVTTFLAVPVAGKRLLVSTEYLLPYFLPWLTLDAKEARDVVWRRVMFDRWHDWLGSGPRNIFAMDEMAAKAFLRELSGLVGGTGDPNGLGLDLPDVTPEGLFYAAPDRRDEGGDTRYPIAQFRDGLALLGRLPRSSPLDSRTWSPEGGFE